MLRNNTIISIKNFQLKVLLILFVFSFSKSWGQVNHIVISQVYGSGGNSSAVYSSDFVELYNPTCASINISAYSVQYTSSSGNTWSSTGALSGSIPAGGYYLIRMTTAGATGSALPTPDFVTGSNIDMSGSNGKVVLVNQTAALSSTVWPSSTALIDGVGYGTAGNFEGSGAAPVQSATKADKRNADCTDSDNNNSDFSAVTPNPRNSATAVSICASCSGPYTVTYNGNGNTGGSVPIDGTSYTSGNSVTVLGNIGSLVKSGCFTFDGWATTAGGAVAYTAGQTFVINANTNLYAHWTSTSFAVTFNNNGGSGSMSNQSNCVAANLNSNTFTKSCATFAGWNTAANGSGTAYADNASYNFTANTTLYAQWISTSHTVIFNSNGGSGSMSNQTACASTALTSNAFTKSGCLFTGWNTAADGSGTAYSNNATYSFSSDITLYAQWDCSICINEDFESGLSTSGYLNGAYTLVSGVWTGTNVIRGTTPHTGSYDCQLQNATGSQITTPTLTNPSQITFWAKLNTGTGNLKINYSTDGGTTWTQISTSALTSTYQQFTISLNLTGSVLLQLYGSNIGTVQIDDVIVTCGTPHTVTFNANGGSGTMSNQTASSTTNLTTNAFTNGACTFTGWNTAANGSGAAYANNAAYSFSVDMTVYAQWNCSPVYTVNFNANGGMGSMSDQSANSATSLTSNAFTNSGCTFVNWNDSANANGTSYSNNAVYSFTSNVTLYAQWNCSSGGGSAGCPYLVSAVVNACSGSCNAEGKNEIVVMNSGNYSIPVNGSNINLYYSGGTNHYFTNSFAGVSQSTVVTNLNTLTATSGCTNTPFIFVPSGGTIPSNSNFMILNNNSCFNGDFSAYCNTGPIYVIISTDTDWFPGGYFGNNNTPRYFRTDFSNVNSGCGLTTYNYNNPSTFGFGSDGASVTFSGTTPSYVNGTGTCAPSIIILPIELIDFYATQDGAKNNVVWKVASEKNVLQYIIEKSDDGVNFIELSRVKANSNENVNQTYQIEDNSPNAEITYYRLSTLENTNEVKHYKIIDLDRHNKNWQSVLYQTNNELVLEFKNLVPKDAQLLLFDLSGKLISQSIVEQVTTKMSVINLATGIYFAKIESPYKIENFKIIIQNDK